MVLRVNFIEPKKSYNKLANLKRRSFIQVIQRITTFEWDHNIKLAIVWGNQIRNALFSRSSSKKVMSSRFETLRPLVRNRRFSAGPWQQSTSSVTLHVIQKSTSSAVAILKYKNLPNYNFCLLYIFQFICSIFLVLFFLPYCI